MSAQTQSAKPSPTGTEDGPRRPDTTDRPPQSHVPPAEAFHQAMNQVRELTEFITLYASVRLDMLKVTVRNLGIYLGLALVGLVAVGAMIVTAVVLLLRGISGGLGQLFSGHPWVGDLITSVVVLAVLAAGIVVVMKKLTGTFRSQTVKKYEDRLRQERQQFGHDVEQRARD